MPAFVIWVPFPATSGCTGEGTGGKFENDKINSLKSHSITFLYQTISHT
ncbi:unnamed protein product, partial [Staurois parvus]